MPGPRGSDEMENVPGSETVILVHGLWMTGMELGLLRRRLTHEHGFDVQVFAYPTLHGDPSSICAELAGAVRRSGGTRVHLVGHSAGSILLGGLAAANQKAGGKPVQFSTCTMWAPAWPTGHCTTPIKKKVLLM